MFDKNFGVLYREKKFVSDVEKINKGKSEIIEKFYPARATTRL